MLKRRVLAESIIPSVVVATVVLPNVAASLVQGRLIIFAGAAPVREQASNRSQQRVLLFFSPGVHYDCDATDLVSVVLCEASRDQNRFRQKGRKLIEKGVSSVY
jgi:hypothetical protein